MMITDEKEKKNGITFSHAKDSPPQTHTTDTTPLCFLNVCYMHAPATTG